MPWRLRSHALSRLLVFAAAVAVSPTEVLATDSLSRPIATSTRDAELWPVELRLELIERGEEGPERILERRRVVVPDGHRFAWETSQFTARGLRTFAVAMVARHHLDQALELEYELEVSEAEYQGLTWSSYWLHRLGLAPRPALADKALRFAEADIVSLRRAPFHHSVTIGHERYEIRVRATSLRG